MAASSCRKAASRSHSRTTLCSRRQGGLQQPQLLQQAIHHLQVDLSVIPPNRFQRISGKKVDVQLKTGLINAVPERAARQVLEESGNRRDMQQAGVAGVGRGNRPVGAARAEAVNDFETLRVN